MKKYQSLCLKLSNIERKRNLADLEFEYIYSF